MAANLPPAVTAAERFEWSSAAQSRSLYDEFLELRTALTQSQALANLGDKPLIVVTAIKGDQESTVPLGPSGPRPRRSWTKRRPLTS